MHNIRIETDEVLFISLRIADGDETPKQSELELKIPINILVANDIEFDQFLYCLRRNILFYVVVLPISI